MKKVELITLQNVPNYGSVLQCYATESIIKKLNYDVETINYLPKRMTKIGMLSAIKNKSDKLEKFILLRTLARIIIFPSYLKRFKIFKKFRKKYLNQTSKIYRRYSDFNLKTLDAEIYCTGSDQVWNTNWNGNIDRALYLEFVSKTAKCISYAASFGKTEFNDEECKQIRKLLKKYSHISVREKSGINVAKMMGRSDAVNVLDPTLLLNGDEWRKISSNKYRDEKYILTYNLNRNEKIDKYAIELSKKTGYKVKYLTYQLHDFYKKGDMICNPIVEDFLALIDNAEVVITDSFHATAFSINFNTNFNIVYPEKFSTRLQSILEIVGLEDRIVKKNQIIDNQITAEKWNLVNSIIEKEREKSISWLEKSLKN